MIGSGSGAVWAPRVLSILRIMAALLFLQHGTQKLFGFPLMPASGALPAFGTLYWWAGIIEFAGGVLLAIGLFTRPVAFILSGQMAVAYFMAHAVRGPWPLSTNGNQGELAIVYCFLFLYFVFAGPGPWSVDAKLGRNGKRPSWA
jgi:putative oxidoreductase